MTRIKFVSLALVAMALQGCSSDKFVGRNGVTLSAPGEMPAPSTRDFTKTPVPFAIGPNDKLSVSVYGIPEATIQLTVDPSGEVSIPVAGTILAAGNTSHELSELIAARLRANHVLHPIVSVNVVDINSQSVIVSGQVTHPGVYAVSGRVTLMGSIARAEGETEYANEKYVVIFRTVSSHQYATLYDLRAIRTGQVADPQVFPGDEIVVGESRARRLFRDVLAAGGFILTPFTTFVR